MEKKETRANGTRIHAETFIRVLSLEKSNVNTYDNNITESINVLKKGGATVPVC